MLARLASTSLRAGAARGLCSAAPAEAPAVMFGTAGRYANALYAAAAKSKALADVEADLTLLKSTLSASPQLASFCSDPSLGRDVKAKGIMEVLTAAKASTTTKNAMATLAENGRLGDVEKVIAMYTELMNASKGEVTAVITSAEALAPEEVKKITAQLDAFLVRTTHHYTHAGLLSQGGMRRAGQGGRQALAPRRGGEGEDAAHIAAAVRACLSLTMRPSPFFSRVCRRGVRR